VDYKKSITEFRKEVSFLAKNPRTGKIIAEKLIKYCEDKLRTKDTIIEKIRLKNSTLKLNRNKLQTQLRQKEEMGEVLHAIDFDQLKIENQQYLSKIEERNEELLKLKMSAGNSSQTLNVFKKRLNTLTTESEFLTKEIKNRQDMMVKLEKEINFVNDSFEKANVTHHRLKSQMEEFRVPEVKNDLQFNLGNGLCRNKSRRS
jgi:chromosome segregation ATPase